MRDLDELDGVDWAGLEHAYGDAADVPELLRSVAAAGDDETLGELLGALCHQGSRYPASAATVPFLAGLALRTPPSTVFSLLGTLGFIAIGDDDAWAFPRPMEADGVGDADAVAAYAAVRAEIPALAPLVAHSDARLADAATWLVSWFPAVADVTLPRVRARQPSTVVSLARGLLGDPDSGGAGGWAGAVADLCATGGSLEEVLGYARRLRGAELVDEAVPYLSGDVAGILAAALRLAPPARRAEATAAMRILADRAEKSRGARIRTLLADRPD